MSFTKRADFQLCVQMKKKFMESSEINHAHALTLIRVIHYINPVLSEIQNITVELMFAL